MSAILLSSQCDSIVTKTCDALIPVVQKTFEAGTNCCDVNIAEAIGKSLVLIFAICVIGFLIWKLIDHIANGVEMLFKKDKEKEESERKQKADLLDKYLDFLKEQASKDDKLIQDYISVLAGLKESQNKDADNAKITKILERQIEFLKTKGFKSNANAENDYQRVLANLIVKSQQNKMNEISPEELKDDLKVNTSSNSNQTNED